MCYNLSILNRDLSLIVSDRSLVAPPPPYKSRRYYTVVGEKKCVEKEPSKTDVQTSTRHRLKRGRGEILGLCIVVSSVIFFRVLKDTIVNIG